MSGDFLLPFLPSCCLLPFHSTNQHPTLRVDLLAPALLLISRMSQLSLYCSGLPQLSKDLLMELIYTIYGTIMELIYTNYILVDIPATYLNHSGIYISISRHIYSHIHFPYKHEYHGRQNDKD